MASPPPFRDRPTLTPLAMFYPNRASSLSGNPYAPPTSSPLSPFSSSPPPSGTPRPPTNSHYYRSRRSTLTSPTRSNISSPAHSPTRSSSRQSRIQSLLATDPLLSRLTPATISRLSSSTDFVFTPAAKEWSLRAAKGTVKVNEWLREVEGWSLAWRQTYRGNKDAGDGYLPPTHRPKKRRKTGMVSIQEEEREDGDKGVFDSPRLVWKRRSFVDKSAGADLAMGSGVESGGGLEMKSSTGSRGLGQMGEPLTPYQSSLQRRKAPCLEQESTTTTNEGNAEERKEGGEVSDQDGESDDGEEYWGSLKRSTVEVYETRIEEIKAEIEDLDVDGLKGKVLSYRTGISNPLTDSSAIITATTLQLLPPLSRLTKLLSVWAVRLAVLRVVPVFLRWLQIAKDALEAGYMAINLPSINLPSSPAPAGWRGLEEESYDLMQETITQKVATAGRLMDTMLDALEGREDVLPDRWITELEEVEEGVSRWEMDGERVVLEGRLRLEEVRARRDRHEEEERERAKTMLVLEQERSALEARAEEDAAIGVMEKAEETDRQLREALEVNDIVAEAIELPDDDEDDWVEVGSDGGEMGELLSKLETVEKERQLTDETETRGRRAKRAGSFDTIIPTNGYIYQEPPLPPIVANPLTVGGSWDGLPLSEEVPELPETTNGFSLVNQVPQTPKRRSSHFSGGTPQPLMVNATPTPPESSSAPESLGTSGTSPTLQPPPPQRPDDEWMLQQLSQLEEHCIEQEETKKENYAKPDRVIHPSAQRTEQTTNSSQGTQAQIGASPEAPVEETRATMPAQPSPTAASDKQVRLIMEETKRLVSAGNPRKSPLWEPIMEPQLPKAVVPEPAPQVSRAAGHGDFERVATSATKPQPKGLGVPSEAREEVGVIPELLREEEVKRQQLTSTKLSSPPQETSVPPRSIVGPTIQPPQKEQQQIRPESSPAAIASGPSQVVVSPEPTMATGSVRARQHSSQQLEDFLDLDIVMIEQPSGSSEQGMAGSGIDAMAEQWRADAERAEAQRLRDEDQTQQLAAAEALEREEAGAEAERKRLEEISRLGQEAERAAEAEAERLKEEARIQRLVAAEALEKEKADAEAERNRLEEISRLRQEAERAAEAGRQRLAEQARLEREAAQVAEAERRKEEARIQQLAAAEALEKNAGSERKRAEEKACLERAVEAEAQRKRRVEEARLEKEAEQAAELKRLALAAEVVEREKAAEKERFAEAERQRLAATRHKEEKAAAAAKALDEQKATEAERAAVVEAARQVFVREQAALIDKKLQELDHQRRLAEDEQIRLSGDLQGETVRIEDMREEEDDRRISIAASEYLTSTEEWGGQSDVETGSVVTAPDHGDDSTSEAFETAAESEDELDYSDVWGAETGYIASGYETPRALEISPPEPIEGVSDATLAEAVRRGSATTSEHPESFEGVAEYGSLEDISLSLLLSEKLLPSPPMRQDSEVSPDKNSQSSEESAPVFGQPSPPSSVDLTPVDTSPWPSPPPGADGGVLLNDAIADLSQDKPSLSLPLAPEEVSETSSDMDSSGGGESEQEGVRIPTPIVESTGSADATLPEIEAENSEARQLIPSSPATPVNGLEGITGLFAQRPPESPAQTNASSKDGFQYTDDEGFSISQDHDYSFATPSILIAPSTPQKGNSLDLEDDFMTTPRGNSMSPISPGGWDNSFVESPLSSALVGGAEANLSISDMYDPDQEDTSEFDIEPIATSTPKPNRRLTVNTELDSIEEILTPHLIVDEYFSRESDTPIFESPYLEDTPLSDRAASSSRAPSISGREKVSRGGMSRDPTRATSASKNRAVAPRSSTPTLGKGLPKDQKQRFSLRPISPVPPTRPASRAQEGRRPSSRASTVATPTIASEARSNSATHRAAPTAAIRKGRRQRPIPISSDEDSDGDDEPGRFLRENTPDMSGSPDFARPPKLTVTKRHTKQPPNFTSLVTPEKSQKSFKSPYNGEGSSLVLPATPVLQADLDDKINTILGSLPAKVRLTASNLQKLSESTNKRPPLLKPFDLPPTGIPGPRSIGSTPSVISEVPSYARASIRRHNPNSSGDIKLYHLHRSDGLAPIKLFIRLVGESGERVMVRVGGGWADLAEYLREYATHHGSKRRVVSEGRVEIQDLSSFSYHSLHPSRSVSSFRSASPGPMSSRPSTPLPGGRSSTAAGRYSPAFGMRRSESPMPRKRSESPALRTNPTMRGGHNGTLSVNASSANANANTSISKPATPTEKTFPPLSRPQVTPPSHNSPPSRPGSRPGSSCSAGCRRPGSRLSFTESAFDDYADSTSGYSPQALRPKPALGLAGPRGKHVQISQENQAWVDGMLGQVRKASGADRRTTLLSTSNDVEEPSDSSQTDFSGREFGGRLTEMSKAGTTRRVFPRRPS